MKVHETVIEFQDVKVKFSDKLIIVYSGLKALGYNYCYVPNTILSFARGKKDTGMSLWVMCDSRQTFVDLKKYQPKDSNELDLFIQQLNTILKEYQKKCKN